MPRLKKNLIIAIDGPAGSGKSTTARALAKRLKAPYIDTGAMYRAVTLKAMKENVSFEDKKCLVEIVKKIKIEFKTVGARLPRPGRGNPAPTQRVFMDGKEVTKAIRLPELTKKVFYVAQEPLVRREMVKKQRAMGSKGGAVMEGRDIGTKVFPDADYKFYFEANEEIRARRRHRELIGTGQNITLEQVLADQKKRDAADYNRREGPLKAAKDAIVLDTSSLTIDETVDKILHIITLQHTGKRRSYPTTPFRRFLKESARIRGRK